MGKNILFALLYAIVWILQRKAYYLQFAPTFFAHYLFELFSQLEKLFTRFSEIWRLSNTTNMNRYPDLFTIYIKILLLHFIINTVFHAGCRFTRNVQFQFMVKLLCLSACFYLQNGCMYQSVLKDWVLVPNLNVQIPISLGLDEVNLWYFKLFDQAEFIVWNISEVYNIRLQRYKDLNTKQLSFFVVATHMTQKKAYGRLKLKSFTYFFSFLKVLNLKKLIMSTLKMTFKTKVIAGQYGTKETSQRNVLLLDNMGLKRRVNGIYYY